MPDKSQQQTLNPWLFWLDITRFLLNHPMMSLAPQRLWQSILPGWIFAQNVMVNPQNSSAPDTELAILAHDSYGRQLGKVIDALDVLIRTGNNPAKKDEQDALQGLIGLHDKIGNTKDIVESDRIARILRDINTLKATRPHDYARLVSRLIAGANDST